jgi:hypothetical protein
MKSFWKYAMLAGLVITLFSGCAESDDDYNPSAESSVASLSGTETDAQVIQRYKEAGYTAFKNTCTAGSSGYGLGYLFLKDATSGTGYEYHGAQVNFTKSSCDSTVTHSLVVQENVFWVDLVTDSSADENKPASAAIGKGMNLYVTDVKITPNSQTIVDKFKATSNASSYAFYAYSGQLTPTPSSIPISDTRYKATGFCGTTDWTVGITNNIPLPGDDTSTDATVIAKNSKDIGLLSAGGLTDCAIPPRGDVTAFYFDVGGPGTNATSDIGITRKLLDGTTDLDMSYTLTGDASSGVQGSDSYPDIFNIQLYLKKGIALSNDASADEVNTIWLTTSQNTGVGDVSSDNSVYKYYSGTRGEIDAVYDQTNTVFVPVQDAFYASKNGTYPFDYITTGSGAYYRED